MNVIEIAKKHQEYAIDIRRKLHEIPELELELPKTVFFLSRKLDELGVKYTYLLEGNAIVVNLEANDSEGPCIGIRADMDALPIEEETGLDFSSQHFGCMHACGHDAHMAIALTTIKILNEHRDYFKGKVKFLFQPGEEHPGGAEPMIKEGALVNPRPDFMIGLHAGRLIEDMPHGSLNFIEGPMMASVDKFEIRVRGKGGHGASPQYAVDPIVIASEIVLALQSIVSRNLAPTRSGLVTIGKFSGGSIHNIIPSEVKLLGTTRTLHQDDRDLIEKRIIEITKGIAHTHCGSAEINYMRKYPAVVNDKYLTKKMKAMAESLFPGQVYDLETATMAGDDMAFFMEDIPGCYMFLSNSKPVEGLRYPHHNSKFDIDEDELYKGIAYFLGAIRELSGLEARN